MPCSGICAGTVVILKEKGERILCGAILKRGTLKQCRVIRKSPTNSPEKFVVVYLSLKFNEVHFVYRRGKSKWRKVNAGAGV
jgi:hypothetical protein